MNSSDSERMAGMLELSGLQPLNTRSKKADVSAEALAKVDSSATALAEADVVIYNSCGVRQMAENRVYGQIHNLRKTNPNIKIILTGCLANRPDVQRRLKNKVDLFCEIKDFPEKISALLAAFPQHRRLAQSDEPADFSHYLSLTPKYLNQHSVHVPIMTGCNNFCSYCVVPYARGPEWSRPVDEIIAEIKQLLKNGAKEITLLGQNVNSYNYVDAKKSKIDFPKLLRKIEKLPCHFWIRFMSSHSKDYSAELIELVTKSKKICEHIHLPIQAGSDEILRKMNRKYTAKDYLELVEEIKSAFKKNKPDELFSLTTDIIIGFPGETKKQFLESAKIMETVKYDLAFFGQFSPRPGTVAWKMKDNVSKEEKARRENYLNDILAKTTYAKNKKYQNRTLEILIDKQSDSDGNDKKFTYFGHTRTLKNVKVFSDKNNLVGEFIRAKITKANVWNLESSLTKRQEKTTK